MSSKTGIPSEGLRVGILGCPVYESVDALLSKVQIADVCLPTVLHRSTVRQAAKAGCQVVCEKPLALDHEEGEAIFRDCDEVKVRIFIAMVVRFFPAYRAAREKVTSGALVSAARESAEYGRSIVLTPE